MILRSTRPRYAAALAATLVATLVATLGFLPLAACSGSGGRAGPAGSAASAAPGSHGAPTPERAVRSFLSALRADDYPGMGRYFGTAGGPAQEKWGVEEVEQRMLVLAGVLDHETADLRPARRSVTDEQRREFVLSLTGTRYGEVTLPVTAVRAGSGRWFVERIDTSGLNP